MTIKEIEWAHTVWTTGVEILGNPAEFREWFRKTYGDKIDVDPSKVYDDLIRMAQGYSL